MNRSFPPGGLIEVLRTVTNAGFGPEFPVENTNWFTSLEAAAAFAAPCARATDADTTNRNSKLSTFLIFLYPFFSVMLTGSDSSCRSAWQASSELFVDEGYSD